DLRHPERANWKLLIPEPKEAKIESVEIARGRLVVTSQTAAHGRVDLYDLDGKPLGELALPGIGSVAMDTEPDRSEAYLSFTSFNYPTSIYRLDLDHPRAALELWDRPA